MTRVRTLVLAVLATLIAVSSAFAADIDRAAVDFKTPADIMGPATSTPAGKR